MSRGKIDARMASEQGRRPTKATLYRGWTIEVYRVGRRHEYQGLATGPDGDVLQTPRTGGPMARDCTGLAAAKLVDQAVAAAQPASLASPSPRGDSSPLA